MSNGGFTRIPTQTFRPRSQPQTVSGDLTEEAVKMLDKYFGLCGLGLIGSISMLLALAMAAMGAFLMYRTKAEMDDGRGGLPFILLLKGRVYYSEHIHIGYWAGTAMFIGFVFMLIESAKAWKEYQAVREFKRTRVEGVTKAGETVADAQATISENAAMIFIGQHYSYFTERLTVVDVNNVLTYWLIYWCLAMSAGWTDGWFLLGGSACIVSSCVLQVLLRILGRSTSLVEVGEGKNKEFEAVDEYDNYYKFAGLFFGSLFTILLTVFPLWGLWMSYVEDQEVSGWDFQRGDTLLSAMALATGFISLSLLMNVGDAMKYTPKLYFTYMNKTNVKFMVMLPFMLVLSGIAWTFGKFYKFERAYPVFNILLNGTMLLAIPNILWKVVWSLWATMPIPAET
jgi:hypothetical protein